MIRNLIHNFESSLGRSTVRVYFSTVQMMMFTPHTRRDRIAAPLPRPRGQRPTLACVLAKDSNTTLRWLLNGSNTSTS